jgi:hypothetical protein
VQLCYLLIRSSASLLLPENLHNYGPTKTKNFQNSSATNLNILTLMIPLKNNEEILFLSIVPR